LAIAVDNLADADSLTTIEKEEGEEAAAEKGVENNEGHEEEEKLSRHASRRSRSAGVEQDLPEEEERLHKTWSKRSRGSHQEEDLEGGEKEGDNFDEGNVCCFILISFILLRNRSR